MLSTNSIESTVTNDEFIKLYDKTKWEEVPDLFKRLKITPDMLNLKWKTKNIVESLINNKQWKSIDYLLSADLLRKEHFINSKELIKVLFENKQWQFLSIFLDNEYIEESALMTHLSLTDFAECSKHVSEAYLYAHREFAIIIALANEFFPNVLINLTIGFLKPTACLLSTTNNLDQQIERHKEAFCLNLVEESLKYYEINFDYAHSLLDGRYIDIFKANLKRELLTLQFILMTDTFKDLLFYCQIVQVKGFV